MSSNISVWCTGGDNMQCWLRRCTCCQGSKDNADKVQSKITQNLNHSRAYTAPGCLLQGMDQRECITKSCFWSSKLLMWALARERVGKKAAVNRCTFYWPEKDQGPCSLSLPSVTIHSPNTHSTHVLAPLLRWGTSIQRVGELDF